MVTQYVVTQRGVIPAEDVNIGDFLYEYGTSNRLEIKHIEKIRTALYDVRYSDNRIEKVSANGLIFNGSEKYRVKEITGKNFPFSQPIQLFPVKFNKDILTKPLDPDAYVAGALFGYGNYEDEFLNIPILKEEVSNGLCNKYGINVTSINGLYHFKWEHSDDLITWKEFFSRYSFYAKNKSKDDPLIPLEYIYTSIVDNMEFIRGVFDTGYNRNDSPDIVSISMEDEERLLIIQRILWSLGIPSYVHILNWKHKLDIIGDKESYPGFFYGEDNITHFVNADADAYKTNPTFYVMVESVTPSLLHFNEDWYEFYTDKKNAVYMSSNYLPIVTA